MVNDVVKWLLGGSSITLAVIYTIGHMLIAIVCVMVITGASIELATLDAIVEPIINGVWFYVLHETWKKYARTS
jgi:uncharacterized membrane protein|tara:strand:- start:1521 stop:1742 length:222 start_codon:yes stop_codon:yes gene_type:complete